MAMRKSEEGRYYKIIHLYKDGHGLRVICTNFYVSIIQEMKLKLLEKNSIT